MQFSICLTKLMQHCLPTCRHMPTFTRQPKLVLTALGDNPRPENNFEKADVSCNRGRSSAITHKIRTFERFRPRPRNEPIDVPRPRVHSSITPYEQNVSRTTNNQLIIILLIRNTAAYKFKQPTN
jgi:hypothetical protein